MNHATTQRTSRPAHGSAVDVIAEFAGRRVAVQGTFVRSLLFPLSHVLVPRKTLIEASQQLHCESPLKVILNPPVGFENFERGADGMFAYVD